MSVSVLEFAAVGRPIHRLGAAIYPVYLPGQNLGFGFSTGATAGLTVSEKPDAEVPTLQVTNSGATAILISPVVSNSDMV